MFLTWSLLCLSQTHTQILQLPIFLLLHGYSPSTVASLLLDYLVCWCCYYCCCYQFKLYFISECLALMLWLHSLANTVQENFSLSNIHRGWAKLTIVVYISDLCCLVSHWYIMNCYCLIRRKSVFRRSNKQLERYVLWRHMVVYGRALKTTFLYDIPKWVEHMVSSFDNNCTDLSL